MNKYCKISKCRYPVTHVTSFHQCGTCKQFGHGMIECNDSFKIDYLRQYYNDQLPESDHCLFGGCDNLETHTSESHICSNCNYRLHSIYTCPQIIKESKIPCPKCRTINNKVFKTFGSENKCIICYEQAQIFLSDCGHECLCLECSKKIDENKSFDYYDEKYLTDHNYNVSLIKTHLKEYPSYIIVYEGMGCYTIVRRLKSSSDIEGLFIHSDDGYNQQKTKINKEFIDGYCNIDISLIRDE